MEAVALNKGELLFGVLYAWLLVGTGIYTIRQNWLQVNKFGYSQNDSRTVRKKEKA